MNLQAMPAGRQDIKIIIGLGNPGKEYEKTYHNAGFLFIDYSAKILNSKSQTLNKLEFQNSKSFQFLKLNNFVFAKPLTFMNESGKAVKETIKYFNAKPEEILIAHDDSDIEIRNYKFSFGRGSAGHNGVESIIKSLGTKNFWRLRIGIRPPEKVSNIKHQAPRKKANEFVLKKINKKDLEILEKVFNEILAL